MKVGLPRRALPFLLPLLFVVPGLARARPKVDEPKMHRVVFELTSADPEVWDGVLNNLEHLLEAFGPEKTEVELVAHGPGIGFLLKTATAQAPRIEALLRHRVVFAACANTMKKKKLTADDLQPGVTVVPAGVAEVVLKQEAGFAYVKSGR